MVLRIGILIASLVSVPALACGIHRSPTRDLAAALEMNNVIGKNPDGTLQDGRDNITVNHRELILPGDGGRGISTEEVKRIRATTGYLVALDSEGKMIGTASAELVENNMTILTTAHSFKDKYGNDFPEGTTFEFQNQDEPYDQVKLRMDKFKVVGEISKYNFDNPHDFAVVQLERPVKGKYAVPFPIVTQPMAMNSPFVLISSYQKVEGKKLDPAIPVAQLANNFINEEGDPIQHYTDADLVPTGSGGAALVRVNGELMYAGFAVSSGRSDMESLRGAPFSRETGSYTFLLGMNGRVRQAILDVAGKTPVVDGLKSTTQPLK